METACRHFNGYKPCGKAVVCDRSCKHRDLLQGSILLIHLGAMGAVLRSTALLDRIHQKYPRHQLTWVTDAPMHRLLEGHAKIDRVLTATEESLQEIRGRHFDVALVIDKSARAAGILSTVQADRVFGFVRDEKLGFIRPATDAADELYSLGLSNELKFFVNRKSETRLVAEALELASTQEAFVADYDFELRLDEHPKVFEARKVYQRRLDQPVIGFNTGCGPLMPAKKWTVAYHRDVIQKLVHLGFENIVLLGGPEDTERNQKIAEGLPVHLSPTTAGVRQGAIHTAACDLVVTGDSFGMHLAIALKKYVVAWFGPSCAHEVDLYARGIKVEAPVGCSPCWKRHCDKSKMCHDSIPQTKTLESILKAVAIVSPPVLESVHESYGEENSSRTTHLGHTDSLSG